MGPPRPQPCAARPGLPGSGTRSQARGRRRGVHTGPQARGTAGGEVGRGPGAHTREVRGAFLGLDSPRPPAAPLLPPGLCRRTRCQKAAARAPRGAGLGEARPRAPDLQRSPRPGPGAGSNLRHAGPSGPSAFARFSLPPFFLPLSVRYLWCWFRRSPGSPQTQAWENAKWPRPCCGVRPRAGA